MRAALRLERGRCGETVTVTTRTLLPRPTPVATERCHLVAGHDAQRFPTPHEAVFTGLRRRPVTVTWEVNQHGYAVVLSPDNVVEVD